VRASKYPRSGLGKLCWLSAGVDEFSPIIQRNRVKAMTLRLTDASNIEEYCVVSSTTTCTFSVIDVMFQFPTASLWQNCRLRVALALGKFGR